MNFFNKRFKGRPLLAVLALLSTPHFTLAESGEESWDRVRQLRVGQKIEVVDMKLKSVRGSFSGCTDEVVVLRVERDEVSIPRTEVFSIKNRGDSHRGRNTLIGLAIGAAGGLAVGAIAGATYHEKGETGVFIMTFAPIGAGIGAGVGAALPSGTVTIYRAKPKNRPVP